MSRRAFRKKYEGPSHVAQRQHGVGDAIRCLSKRAPKPFGIEWRYRDVWTPYKRYATEAARDEALRTLRAKDKHFEYRVTWL